MDLNKDLLDKRNNLIAHGTFSYNLTKRQHKRCLIALEHLKMDAFDVPRSINGGRLGLYKRIKLREQQINDIDVENYGVF